MNENIQPRSEFWVLDYSYKTLTCDSDSATCLTTSLTSLQHEFAMKTVQFETDIKIPGLKELIVHSELDLSLVMVHRVLQPVVP